MCLSRIIGTPARPKEADLHIYQVDIQINSSTTMAGTNNIDDSSKGCFVMRIFSAIAPMQIGSQLSPTSNKVFGDLRRGCISVYYLNPSHDGSAFDNQAFLLGFITI